ncbi:MAG: hypothetical protein R3F34_04505 [Planctomycetota bacterium]
MNASDGPGHEACRARGHHTLRGSWRALDADVRRFLRETRGTGEGRVGALTRVSALTTPQGLVVLLHRLSHLLWVRGWRRLAELVHWANHLLHKVSIRPDSCLDGGLWVPHPPSVAFHGTGGRDVGLYADSACLPVDPSSRRLGRRGRGRRFARRRTHHRRSPGRVDCWPPSGSSAAVQTPLEPGRGRPSIPHGVRRSIPGVAVAAPRGS